MGIRTDENAHPNECSFPANLRAPCYSPRLIRSQVCADKIRAECRQIENDHDEREEIHPHREADPDVHCTNANQPNLSRLAVPNEKWISDFQETNKDSRDWEQIPPSHEYLGINNVKRRPYQCPPHIRTVPPPAPKAFRKAAKKIDHAQVELEDAPPETKKLRIFRLQLSYSPVERMSIRQRRRHQVEKSDRHKVIHAIGHERSALGYAQVQKPSQNRREATGKADKKTAAGSKQTNPCAEEYCFFRQAKLRSETDKPSQSRDRMALQRKHCLRQLAASSRKQIIPIVSQR